MFYNYDKNNPSVGDVNAFRSVEMLSNRIQLPEENSDHLLYANDYEPHKSNTTFTRGVLEIMPSIKHQYLTKGIGAYDGYIKIRYRNKSGRWKYRWIKDEIKKPG